MFNMWYHLELLSMYVTAICVIIPILQAVSSENVNPFLSNTSENILNVILPMTFNFTISNVTPFTEFAVRVVATYTEGMFSDNTCPTLEYDGVILPLTTLRKF